jgi:hypothetical protein
MGVLLDKDDFVKLLTEYEIDLDSVDNDGKTALIYAAQLGNKEIVRLLLTKGANLNVQDHSGRTAMNLATVDVMPILAQYGASYSFVNRIKRTIFYMWKYKLKLMLLAGMGTLGYTLIQKYSSQISEMITNLRTTTE